MIPIAGLQKAKGYVAENSPHNYPSDLSPEFPLGPVGKSVMFVGASLQAAQLNDKYIVSVTRDGPSGEMLLEALPIAPLPMKLDEIWSEFDFQGGGPAARRSDRNCGRPRRDRNRRERHARRGGVRRERVPGPRPRCGST